MIKYLGSKRLLLPDILEAVRGFGAEVRTVLDLFSGTSRVGHALKAAGYRVIANDHNAYAHVLAQCYVEADRDEVLPEAESLLGELAALPARPGYFTETFCEKARFFHPRNGARVDAIRDALEAKALPPSLRAVVLTSLMEAADRVDSTTGVQMAYLKRYAPRALNDLALRLPDVLPRALQGKGEALAEDALVAAGREADLAYLDPPYNQHAYLANYHIWETLVRWDRPPAYGVAQKRSDVRVRKSAFNRRRDALAAFAAVVDAVRAPRLIVSFSDEGFIAAEDAIAVLSRRGPVRVFERDYARYVGARIGIYNPRGEKVGTVSHTRNKERLFIVGPS